VAKLSCITVDCGKNLRNGLGGVNLDLAQFPRRYTLRFAANRLKRSLHCRELLRYLVSVCATPTFAHGGTL
jgi:hypothetical protein